MNTDQTTRNGYTIDHPESSYGVMLGVAGTGMPIVADLIGATTSFGVVGCVTALGGVGAITLGVTVREAPTATALCGAAGVAWGSYMTASAFVPSFAPLSQLAVGAFMTFASWAAGRAVEWKRAGTPIERTKLELERIKLAAASMPIIDAEVVDDDRDPTRVLPVVKWDGPREDASVLDTIEIAPGVFVPVDAHMLIGGTTGGGKSGITDLIVCSLIGRPAARVTGVDMKPGAPELGVYRRAGVDVVTGKEDAADTIRSLNDEMDRRGAELERLTAETGRKHASWTPTAQDPHLFLVVDELTEMLDAFGAAEKGLFYRLLRLSRAFAITLICATQSPRAKMFGEEAGASGRGQFGVRICLATKQSSETRLILDDLANEPGWKDAHRMPKQGHFLIDAPGHTEPRVRRAFLAGDDMVSDLIDRFADAAAPALSPPGPLRKALATPVAVVPADPDAEPPFVLGARVPATVVVPEPAATTVRDRILGYLAEHGEGRAAEMAPVLDIERKTLNATLALMRKAGQVDSDKGGLHWLSIRKDNVIPFARR